MNIAIIVSIVSTIVAFAIGYIAHNEKDKQKMKSDILHRLQREEVHQVVELKIKPVEIEVREIKADVLRIEKKVDLLIDALINRRG